MNSPTAVRRRFSSRFAHTVPSPWGIPREPLELAAWIDSDSDVAVLSQRRGFGSAFLDVQRIVPNGRGWNIRTSISLYRAQKAVPGRLALGFSRCRGEGEQFTIAGFASDSPRKSYAGSARLPQGPARVFFPGMPGESWLHQAHCVRERSAAEGKVCPEIGAYFRKPGQMSRAVHAGLRVSFALIDVEGWLRIPRRNPAAPEPVEGDLFAFSKGGLTELGKAAGLSEMVETWIIIGGLRRPEILLALLALGFRRFAVDPARAGETQVLLSTLRELDLGFVAGEVLRGGNPNSIRWTLKRMLVD